ncbi:AAA-ATPase At3g50940-like [Vitis vinifera]|uniref:AAA-ATPase At3g50940-like n=1 Tax=Vitis vinifera TaxID=29760 RepID=UPI0008FEC554|nr:AAA-ATPase At3g50940-like [Vitis vinifera]|eukprot:XP_019078901.1 PREDICTED: AAA-ATPase At3g50940-like [Vitis vinifera]
MKYKEKVLSTYLPYVLEISDTIEEENRVVKLYSLGNFNEDYNGPWTSINVDHPSTFDTLAMEPMLKKELIADFDRLVKRWEGQDIDCSIESQNFEKMEHTTIVSQIILSGLLDFIDGLWSSFGDERIIMLTTNHKECLDPACIVETNLHGHAFRSSKVTEMEKLIMDVEGNPAEIAEELF